MRSLSYLLGLAVCLSTIAVAGDFATGLTAYQKGDYVTAAKEWRPLAEQGDAPTQYNLGLLYLFSPSVPGVASPDDQLAKAIQEFEAFKSMRGAKVGKGPGDDVDDLLNNAKRKQSELNMKKQAAAAAAAPPPAPAGSAAPAPAGSAAPAPSK